MSQIPPTIPQATPPGVPGSPAKSWWGRNWKWVLPVGCLTPIVVCGGGAALIISIVFGAIKSSDVYKGSLAAARANPQVQAALGTPIEPAFIVAGQININNATGAADITYNISGPKGTAKVHAVAALANGKWTYSTLTADIKDTSEHIDLMESASP